MHFFLVRKGFHSFCCLIQVYLCCIDLFIFVTVLVSTSCFSFTLDLLASTSLSLFLFYPVRKCITLASNQHWPVMQKQCLKKFRNRQTFRRKRCMHMNPNQETISETLFCNTDSAAKFPRLLVSLKALSVSCWCKLKIALA